MIHKTNNFSTERRQPNYTIHNQIINNAYTLNNKTHYVLFFHEKGLKLPFNLPINQIFSFEFNLLN